MKFFVFVSPNYTAEFISSEDTALNSEFHILTLDNPEDLEKALLLVNLTIKATLLQLGKDQDGMALKRANATKDLDDELALPPINTITKKTDRNIN
jgi:hypothetical protein